jgi:DNA-binding MarR family transcriptional regulator
LAGMQRWGYVKVDECVRPTGWGRRAAAIWRQVPAEIEARWRTRFGAEDVDRLQGRLTDLVSQLDPAPPDWLPIVGYGWWSRPGQAPREHGDSEPGLAGLLAQVLVAFAAEFEDGSPLSLAVCANALRVLDAPRVAVRDVPSLAGVSKEAATVAIGLLEREGYATIELDPGARVKLVRLTAKGQRALEAYRLRIRQVEAAWADRFGAENMNALRAALSDLIRRRVDGRRLLAVGLEPDPDGWRAAKPYAVQTEALLRDPAAALPHYPVVSHRGGFPDGS